MKKLNNILLLISFVAFLFNSLNAQQKEDKPKSYLDMNWREVAAGMPDEWYGSDEAKSVAENVLAYQKKIGGWSKNIPFHHPITESEKLQIIKNKSDMGATFDNGATITEMKFLVKVYTKIKDERYRDAFKNGLNYIFKAQYLNGGWPQFFPYREGESVVYASHITYNDDAMVNIMTLLRDAANEKDFYAPMQLSSEIKAKAKDSFDKGVECILKTQIIVDSKPTVWCAQHDEFTFVPAKARAYELPSFSGQESVGITLLLMEIENPSKEIIRAVNGSVKWFEKNKIEGIKIVPVNKPGGSADRIVVEDKTAPAIWARFYDLETGKPFFCDRDGIKKNTLAEIGYERRSRYGWYTTAPEELIKKYPDWVKTHK